MQEVSKKDIETINTRIDKLEKQQESYQKNNDEKLNTIDKNVSEILTIQRLRVEIEDLKDKNIYTELSQTNENNSKRIDKIEGNSEWLWRTIIGTTIGTIIGFIVSFIKNT